MAARAHGAEARSRRGTADNGAVRDLVHLSNHRRSELARICDEDLGGRHRTQCARVARLRVGWTKEGSSMAIRGGARVTVRQMLFGMLAGLFTPMSLVGQA